MRKKGWAIGIIIVILAGIGVSWFLKGTSNSPSSTTPVENTSDLNTIAQKQETPTKQETPSATVSFLLTRDGEKLTMEELTSPDRRAVEFIRDFINTESDDIEDQVFARLKNEYFPPGYEQMKKLMGYSSFPPFKAGRHLKEIALNRTLEQMTSVYDDDKQKVIKKPAYTVFMRVYFDDQNMDFPVFVDVNNYVRGYNDKFPGSPLQKNK